MKRQRNVETSSVDEAMPEPLPKRRRVASAVSKARAPRKRRPTQAERRGDIVPEAGNYAARKQASVDAAKAWLARDDPLALAHLSRIEAVGWTTPALKLEIDDLTDALNLARARAIADGVLPAAAIALPQPPVK